jgi:hypothetical protein
MKTLAASRHAPRSSCAARSAKGWTPERRARQAALIRRCQPWRCSTGPKTDAGKARVAINAFRHGHRGRAWLQRARRIRNAIRLCADTVLLARALMLARSHAEAGSPHNAVRTATTAVSNPVSRPQPPAALPGFAGIGQTCRVSRFRSSHGFDIACLANFEPKRH